MERKLFNPTDLNHTVEHLFRHESGKMLSVLMRIFGTLQLELAEDIVQDTLLKAFEVWKFKGIPENPSAWLMKVAKNKALDIIRKEKVRSEFSNNISSLLKTGYTLNYTLDKVFNSEEIADDQLRMMFCCCHPDLQEESQLALILKTLCGFSVREIAKAFLSNEETIGKRLYRAKQFFREHKMSFEIPDASLLPERLDGVLKAIYLLFNEGYQSSSHKEVIRLDLIEEAMRLCWLLIQNPKTNFPNVYALLSLMCFHAARSESRIGMNGELLLLDKQDRSLWDKKLISKGIELINIAIQGNNLSPYHFEAAIAREHCVAESYEKTNWHAILFLYELLYRQVPSAVVALNKAIVIRIIDGSQKALEAIEQIPDKDSLMQYYLYHVLMGDIYTDLGRLPMALGYYQKAISLTQSDPEKDLIKNKIERLEEIKNSSCQQ